MADEPTGSDLEQRMRNDETGATRDGIQRSLQDEAARLKRTMDSGVAPAQFAGLQKQYEGVHAGAEVAAFVWKRYHGG